MRKQGSGSRILAVLLAILLLLPTSFSIKALELTLTTPAAKLEQYLQTFRLQAT